MRFISVTALTNNAPTLYHNPPRRKQASGLLIVHSFPPTQPAPYSVGSRTNAPNSFSKRSFFPSCSKMEPAGVSSSTGTYSPQTGHETICTILRTSAPSARPRRNLTPAQLPQSIRSRVFASHGMGIFWPHPGQGSVLILLTRRAPAAPQASPYRSPPPSPRL